MRFRSLLVACALPLAATGAVYGCSGPPTPEDFCGWLQNPEAPSCVTSFHEDIKDKCGALDFATVTGTFAQREALDMCVLTSKGGAVVFDPPIDLVQGPQTNMPTTMKIMNADGSSCGEIMVQDKFTWSLKIDPPPSGTGGGGGAGGGGTTTGQGGGTDSGSRYSMGLISVTQTIGGDTVQIACPAPDILASGVIAAPESHFFNLNQVLASTTLDGCPQFAGIIPQAILEVDPGGVLRTGSLRLKILYPPRAVLDTKGTGGAAASTGTSSAPSAAPVAPEVVYYFDCAIPAAPLVCANGIKDASEVDVDCGGPESTPTCPARCATGQLCVTDCDCDASTTCKIDAKAGGAKVCTADPLVPAPAKGVCGGIICANGVKDSSESDVDCGGVCTTQLCVDGLKCNANTDCLSNSCTLGLCGPPTCTDKAANGDETDVDCGGTVCEKCDDGKKCASGSDCKTAGCLDNLCSACGNTMKDGTESDIDCGGTSCSKCVEGKICSQNSDCATDVCTGGKCNGCGNGKKDGKESDVDCGGPDCKQCDDGKICMAAKDCASNGCLNGKCSPCADGMQNGAETDVDCGGGTCPKCANGKVCAMTSDCANGECDGFKCGSCTDGLKDGDESDVDCGGSCPGCAETKVCFAPTDCALGVCEFPPPPATSSSSSSTGGGPTPGVCNTCNNMMKDGTETFADCGGLTCKKCLKTQTCKINLDCMSGICIGQACQ